jgi:hypothetical protein
MKKMKAKRAKKAKKSPAPKWTLKRFLQWAGISLSIGVAVGSLSALLKATW